MPKPQSVPDFSGQNQIMFVTEGNPTAMLLTNRSGTRKMDAKTMSAEAAFVWCRQHRVTFVYLPANPAQN
jgi:hypothetical protein